MVDWNEPTIGRSGEGEDEDASQRAAQWSAARRRFMQLASRPDGEIDLAEGALLIAAEERPGLDIAAYHSRLDALAERVRRQLALRSGGGDDRPPHNADEVALEALHTILFEEEGFTGAAPEDFTNPRNSLLSDVLDRKRGLPITLSVVYCEVARRAGLHAVGIGLPGYFVAQFRGRQFSTFVDPYRGGARLQRQDCLAIVRRLLGPEVELADEHFQPAAPKMILARILNNLKEHHLHHGHLAKALQAVERILMLQPSLEQVRDRGLILRDMGLFLLSATRLPRAEESEEPAAGRPIRRMATSAELPDPQPAVLFLSSAWFDLKLYAREAAGQPDAKAAGSAADNLWSRLGRQN